MRFEFGNPCPAGLRHLFVFLVIFLPLSIKPANPYELSHSIVYALIRVLPIQEWNAWSSIINLYFMVPDNLINLPFIYQLTDSVLLSRKLRNEFEIF